MMGFRESSQPLQWHLSGPPKDSASHFAVFQVAGGNGQSGPSCPPGRVLAVIFAFILVSPSKGQRIKVGAMPSTLGPLRSALKAGKADFKSTGFPTQSHGELAFLLFVFFPGVCLTFLPVSSMGRRKLGWNLFRLQSSPLAPREVKNTAAVFFSFPKYKASGMAWESAVG